MTQSIEGIRGDAVSAWFEAHIPGAQGPFSFSLIAGGHSNLTYAVDDAAGQRFVLRRPPLGHVLQSAHDVAREHRIISALASSAVPVAPALGLCEDLSVNEAPFYVMSFVDGTVLHDADSARDLPAEARAAIGDDVVDVLDVDGALLDARPARRARPQDVLAHRRAVGAGARRDEGAEDVGVRVALPPGGHSRVVTATGDLADERAGLEALRAACNCLFTPETKAAREGLGLWTDETVRTPGGSKRGRGARDAAVPTEGRL